MAIVRTVGRYSHVLNVATGEIMTFEITADEAEHLIGHWEDPELKLRRDVKELFRANGQPNSRLCRAPLNDLGVEFKFPAMVNMELNRRCSLRCVHCYIGKTNLRTTKPSVFESMSLEQLSSLFDQLKALGVFLLVFTGGEPFLNRHFREAVEMATRKGFAIEIFSNLQKLPSWLAKNESNEAKIGRIQVSVYSSDPAVHDAITTVRGSFDKTLRNLLHLQVAGFYLEVATPLMLPNFPTWQDTEQYFGRLGIQQHFSWPILSEYYSKEGNPTLLNIDSCQLREFLDSHHDFLTQVKMGRSRKPLCGIGLSMFCIAANGEVYPCTQLPSPVGNICQDSIETIYHSEAMQKYRSIRRCDTGLQSAYNYCLGENFTETGDPLKQSPQISATIREALKF